MGRQRQLYQNAVHGGILIRPLDNGQQGVERHRRRQRNDHRRYTDVAAGPGFVRHIQARGRIVADQSSILFA
jgi:hypothetical protein